LIRAWAGAPSADTLGEVLGWMQQNLHRQVTVAQLAGLRHHFRTWCSTTPHTYRRAFRAAPGGSHTRDMTSSVEYRDTS
jgi:transcriptional regulator GlxA family with amidase domain